MQFSISASGSRDEVLAAVGAQVAKEKARLADQHARDRKVVPAASADAFPGLEAAAGVALDGVASFVQTDLGDVEGDEHCAVSIAVTIHRPQR